MKHWWLKLYTIPALKKYSWPLVAWFVANILCVVIFPKIKELTYPVAMFPWYVFLNYNEYTLAFNIDFHRGHVPFKELRLAILLDLVIQVGFFLFFFWFSAWLPWFQNVNSEHLLDILGTDSMFTLIMISVVIVLITPKLGVMKQKQLHKLKSFSLSERKFDYILAMFFMAVGIYLIKTQSISYYLVSYVLISAIIVSILIEWYLENFHSLPSKQTMIKLVCLPVMTLTFIGIAWLTSFQARNEIANAKLPTEKRLSTFLMFQDFNVILGPSEASDFLATDFGEVVAKQIFRRSELEVFEIEVEKVITQPNFKIYTAYLETGKAQEHNLEYLYEQTTKDKEQWKNPHYYEKYRQALIRQLPVAKSLPERNIATKKGGSI